MKTNLRALAGLAMLVFLSMALLVLNVNQRQVLASADELVRTGQAKQIAQLEPEELRHENKEGRLLFLAIDRNQPAVLATLLNRDSAWRSYSKWDMNPLHYAAKFDRPNCVRAFVEIGAPIDVLSGRGEQAIHYAAEHGTPETLSELLKAGADINARTRNRTTPLIRAADAGSIEIVKFLVERGADLNVKSSRRATSIGGSVGMTALDMAERDGHAQVVKYLKSKGAKRAIDLE